MNPNDPLARIYIFICEYLRDSSVQISVNDGTTYEGQNPVIGYWEIG